MVFQWCSDSGSHDSTTQIQNKKIENKIPSAATFKNNKCRIKDISNSVRRVLKNLEKSRILDCRDHQKEEWSTMVWEIFEPCQRPTQMHVLPAANREQGKQLNRAMA